MVFVTATIPCSHATDPGALSPSQWQAKNAALRSRGGSDTDPRVAECVAALAYWRVRRAIDAEAGQIAPDHLDALVLRLREAVTR